MVMFIFHLEKLSFLFYNQVYIVQYVYNVYVRNVNVKSILIKIICVPFHSINFEMQSNYYSAVRQC